MADNIIYVGDVGTKIVFDVSTLVDDVVSASIYCKKPNGTSYIWTAEKELGTNNIYYITQVGDIDVAGIYKLQPFIDFADWRGFGDIVQLIVKETLV